MSIKKLFQQKFLQGLFVVVLIFGPCGGVFRIGTKVNDNPIVTAAIEQAAVDEKTVVTKCENPETKSVVQDVEQVDGTHIVRILVITPIYAEFEGKPVEFGVIYMVWLPEYEKFAAVAYDRLSNDMFYLGEYSDPIQFNIDAGLATVVYSDGTIECLEPIMPEEQS